MKRLFTAALAMVLPLLVFFACTDRNDENQTEKKTADANARVEFSLPALPDIGSYQQKTVRYFYNEPLEEFKPAENYGKLIPYRILTGSMEFRGLITEDGRIVTAPIFTDVISYEKNGEVTYYAVKRDSFYKPAQAAEAEEMPPMDEALYDSSSVMITGDGSEVLEVEEGFLIDPIVDHATGYYNFYFRYRPYNTPEDEPIMKAYLYDHNLKLKADLSGKVTSGQMIQRIDGDRILLSDMSFDPVESTKLIVMENGAILSTASYDFYTGEFGSDVLSGKDGLYDFNGKRIASWAEDSAVCYDEATDSFYVADPVEGSLNCWRNGKIAHRFAGLPATADFVSVSGAGGDKVITVECGYQFPNSLILTFDAALRPLGSVDCGGYDGFSVETDDETNDFRFICRYTEAETEILDRYGELIVKIPSEFDTYGIKESDGAFYLTDGFSRVCRFTPEEETLQEVELGDSLPEQTDFWILSADRNKVVVSRPVFTVSEEELMSGREIPAAERIISTADGSVLYDNVRYFDENTYGGRTYCCFNRYGYYYFCDEAMRVIALIPDPYFS